MRVKPLNVFDYERLAEEHLEPGAWAYFQSGSEDEVAVRANCAAFECINYVRVCRQTRSALLSLSPMN